MKLTLNRTLINDSLINKTSRSKIKVDKGIVYVLEFVLEGKKLVKIGITTRKVEDRVCEILVSIWKRYRVFPECCVKRYSSFANPKSIEKKLHKELADYRYKPKYVFSGHTEFFEIDLESAVALYDKYKD